jgi:hypothetical protein
MSIKGFEINGNIEKIDYDSLDNLPTIPASEECVELLNTTLTEDVAYVDLVAPEGKMFKKIHIHIQTNAVGLSASSKILILGNNANSFTGSNREYLTVTNAVVGTWAYPVFIIEKGELFPVALATNGVVNGSQSTSVYMGGVGQNNRYYYYNDIGPWKLIRIKPQTADVVFKAGVSIYAWGVYE